MRFLLLLFIIANYLLVSSGNSLCPSSSTKSLLDSRVQEKNGTSKNPKKQVLGCICNLIPCIGNCSDSHVNLKGIHDIKKLSFGIFNYSQIVAYSDPSVILFHKNKCEFNKKRYKLENEDEFFLQQDGKLYVPFYSDKKKMFDLSDYCLEVYIDEYSQIQYVPKICFTEEDAIKESKYRWVLSTGMSISIPFLLTTFIVYALLPERQNLHGKCLMSYVFTLMLAYSFLIFIQYSDVLPTTTCTILGVLCYFFFMVAIFWVNSISISIWRSFRGIRKPSESNQKKQFYFYSLYAWGAPIILVVIVLSINHKISDYHPGIGHVKCWFNEGLPSLIYFYLPMSILLLVNVTMFISTSIQIKKVKEELSSLNKDETSKYSSMDYHCFKLYFKLLMAMGVNWIGEIISWAVLWKHPEYGFVVYISDLINALYGVFIFFMFVCQEKTWVALKSRYQHLFSKTQYTPTGGSDRTTSFSLHSMDNGSKSTSPM